MKENDKSSHKDHILKFAHLKHLHAHKFEAFHLESLEDLSNDASLHTVRLDGNEGTLFQVSHDSEIKQRLKTRFIMKQKETLQLQQITHGSFWHLAQAAVGSAAEGPDPIAQRSQTERTCVNVEPTMHSFKLQCLY